MSDTPLPAPAATDPRVERMRAPHTLSADHTKIPGQTSQAPAKEKQVPTVQTKERDPKKDPGKRKTAK